MSKSIPVMGKVIRGDATRVVTAASTLSNLLDDSFEKAIAPKTAADRMEAERAAAIAQGYQDGLLRAKAEVEAAMDDSNKRVQRALAALCDAVETFDQRQTVALADVDDAIAMGALAIASAVLQRELNTMSDPGAEAIIRAIALAPNRGEVIARLHPEDAQTLNMDSVSTGSRTVRVVADPKVEPGGCIVDAGELRVDAQISSALDNVRTALRLDGNLPMEVTEPLAMQPVSSAPKSEVSAGLDTQISRTTASEAPQA